jgi:subtilase family serine protease
MHTRSPVVLFASAAAMAAFAAGVVPSQAGATVGGRRVIVNTAPSALAARALAGGTTTAAAANRRLSFQVQLSLRDAATAERVATAVSTPGTAQYGHYLSPAAFNARFAPTPAQARGIEGYLASYGITVRTVAPNRRYIVASGTVAQVSRAFSVQMRAYSYGGRRYLTDDRAVSVPAALAPTILTVTGLNETGGAKPGLIGQDATGVSLRGDKPSQNHLNTPCSRYWAQRSAKLPAAYGKRSFPTSICGYTPDQLQSAYGMQGQIAQGHNGSGVHVAIIDAYRLPTMEADADRYFKHYGETGFAQGQFSEVLPKSYTLQTACDEASWQTEEALDVESVHGLAPGADVTYVAGRSCSYQGLLTPLNKIVNGHLADIVSNSWGLFNEGSVPTSWLTAYHAVLVQAAAEGIGLYFCDLDNGDTSGQSGSAEPVYPASDPMATGVGGTSLALDQNGAYLFETGWGNDRSGVTFDDQGNPTGYNPPPPGTFYAGTGGGVSTLFRQPSYQKGAVPDSLSHFYGGPAMRVEPDISADADPYTGYRLGYTDPSSGAWVTPTYGGTSLATPLVSAMVADASQGRATPIGFFNPLLYQIASKRTIHDVLPTRTPVGIAFTSTNNASICYTSCLITQDRDTSLTTAYGYDDVTGLGTPDGEAFLRALKSAG